MATKNEFHVSTMFTALTLALAGAGYCLRFGYRLLAPKPAPAPARRGQSSRLAAGFLDPTATRVYGCGPTATTTQYVQYTGRVRRSKR